MSSRALLSAGALVILALTGHALAEAGDKEHVFAGERRKSSGRESRAPRSAALGATVESLLAAARELNPALLAAALETSVAAAKAASFTSWISLGSSAR